MRTMMCDEVVQAQIHLWVMKKKVSDIIKIEKDKTE